MALSDVTTRFETSAAPGLPTRVEAFRFVETIDEPYLLETELDLGLAELDAAELLGRDAVFFLERLPLTRRVHGVVRTVREGGRGADGGVRVHVEIVPALWMLSLRRDTRMFQEQTVPEILEAVLSRGLSPYGRALRLDLDATYPRREYCLQYQETDLAFAARLMEEEGIHYVFDQEGDVEELVLRDRNDIAEPVATTTEGVLLYQPHTLAVTDTEPMHRFFRDHDSVTTAVALRDLDWTSGSLIVEDARAGEDDRGRTRESYEHGEGRSLTISDYAGRRYGKNDRARQLGLRAEAHGAKQIVARGIGRAIGLTPGTRFRLMGHPGIGVDDEYLVTRVVHRDHEAEELREGGGTERYHNEIECVPLRTPHRPARRTPKPRIMSMQTAVVTGPAGEEIHTDEWGRVKVQFHWDRENPANETSSTWVRVRQEWVGMGWGSLWIPRIGVEVVVQFVDGDPDRPIVTGTLYNANNPPPYDLPAQKTKSTIKSNSSLGGGGFNELRFEDAAGGEEIFIHAQKDRNGITLNCETNTVGVNETITIGVNQTQTVGVNQTESVGANQTLTVGANRSITVGATFTETIAASSTITVSGHATETLNAGETQTVNAGRTETVNGGETRTVNGGQTETINGGCDQTINGGITQAITGAVGETFDGSHTCTTTGSLTHTIIGGATVTTPASYTLVALGGYNLLCPAGGNVTAVGGWQVIAAAGQTWLESTIDKVTSLEFKSGATKFSASATSISATGVSASLTGVSLSQGGVKIAPEALKVYTLGPEITISGMHLILSGVTVAISAVRLLA